MSDLEKFANNDMGHLPDLLKIALIHYQFETIHPFLDGNGRVGRLMITLYLVGKGILKRPILYLSDFFERNKQLYYDNLMRVRTHNDISQWFKFFLVGVTETSEIGIRTFDGILQLQKDLDKKIKPLKSRGGDVRKVVEHLFKHPVIDAAKVAAVTEKTFSTAYKLIDIMESLGIVKEITRVRRGKIYSFDEYLGLFTAIGPTDIGREP